MNRAEHLTILAIETSCDETAAAIVRGRDETVETLSNVVSSQIPLHAQYGGVVPNLAAREHVANILPVVSQALREANVDPDDIDLLAVTNGPGLIPALLVGTDTMKTLSWLWKKPLVGIHHIEGHIYANFLVPPSGDTKASGDTEIRFPLLALVVSGGHTQLMLARSHGEYEIVGQTRDDAVGEAFDKTARLLGLGYPGGPAIAKRASSGEAGASALGPIRLPRPMIHSKDLDFSFSGIKTAVLTLVKKNKDKLSEMAFVDAVAREFQNACVEVLVSKTLRAAGMFAPKCVVLAGGVSANEELRRRLGEKLAETHPEIAYRVPHPAFCIDNASMIAAAAYFRWNNMSDRQRSSSVDSWKNLRADSNLKLAKES